MRLDTKEKRLEYRKSFIFDKENTKVIDMPEIELQAFISNNPEKLHYTLAVFIGTAGKPQIYYSYRSKERRDAELQKAIDSQKKRLEYKAQRREENKGKLTGAAATAAAIKARLKKEFPGIKFSVRSENFSMGNSVDIEWTDGPMSEAVDAIVKQYEYGRFDGMQDLAYNVKIDEEGLGCPGAKYVHTGRRLSDEYRARVREVLEANFAPYHGRNYGNDNYAPFQWTEAEKMLLGIVEPKPEADSAEVITATTENTTPAAQKSPTPKTFTLDCGCTVTTKKEIHFCRDCGLRVCSKHLYFYVDESNIAITKNSPGLCADCYNKRYKPKQTQPSREPEVKGPSNVIDITARLKSRQEQREAEEAINTFMADYLPLITPGDMEKLLSCPEAERGNVIARMCLRIDFERVLKKKS
jgi:hypothetical protein